MSRFFDFSLYRRTDELLRPSEKQLSREFHSSENTQLVYKRALSEVDSGPTYADVTASMDQAFRLSTQKQTLPSVEDMNSLALLNLSRAAERLSAGQKRYAERAFTNSNIPTRILPRPSHTSLKDGDGEEEGGDLIELLRR